jgi:DNA-binding phage protein
MYSATTKLSNVEVVTTAPTLEQLAKKLGICRTTVDKILHNKGRSFYRIQITKLAQNSN